jgi:hypothetical protein
MKKANYNQERNPELAKFYAKIANALIHDGINLSVKNSLNRSVLDLALLSDYKIAANILKRAKRNATNTELNRNVRFFSNDATDPMYTFSQMGGTCGSDAFFTFLIQSDATAPFVTPFKVEHDSGAVWFNDPLFLGISFAFGRYDGTHALQCAHTKGRMLTRLKSGNNSVEAAKEMKEALTLEKSSFDSGINAVNIIEASRQIFTEDKYGIFGIKDYLRFEAIIKAHSAEDREEKFVEFKKEPAKICGIFLGIKDERTEAGHALFLFKKNGLWVLSDNNTGMLHIFRDQSFIDDHFIPVYLDNPNNIVFKFIRLLPTLNYSIEIMGERPAFYYPIMNASIRNYLAIAHKSQFTSSVIYSLTPAGAAKLEERTVGSAAAAAPKTGQMSAAAEGGRRTRRKRRAVRTKRRKTIRR